MGESCDQYVFAAALVCSESPGEELHVLAATSRRSLAPVRFAQGYLDRARAKPRASQPNDDARQRARASRAAGLARCGRR